jgi:type IV pilus assembly protein PilY1
MSPDGSGFVFTNTQAAGSRYVANPCQNYKSLASTNPVYQNRSAIDTSGQVTGDVSASHWMQVSASSDDPLINDVLYWGGSSAVCMVYGGPSPANPWPPNFSLSQYNSNPANIHESYVNQTASCARTTYPTNAGFVPYTPQTMYILRGFGYGGSQSAAPPNNSYWSPLVGMTSAGQNPTGASVSTAIAKFTPYLAPETDSTSTTEIKASAGQSALAGLLANAQNYYQYKNPASSIAGCSAQRYVILLTDGLPTLDLSGKSWPPPGTIAATNYGMTVNFNANGTLDTSNTNDAALLDTIATLASLNAAGIKTYVIGLGAGVDPTQNPVAANVLKAMAIAGGTSDYFAAKDPVTLISSLNVILAKIQQATQSTSSSAVNSSGIHYGSVAYQAQFTTSDSYQDWTGNFLALPIDASTGAVNTDPASAEWSAQTQLDGQAWNTGRLIATWDPVTQAGIPFEWTTGTPTSGIASSTVCQVPSLNFTSQASGDPSTKN